MKQYSSDHLVKSEDLNHHGTLFAARTASWFVESAFVAAACEHKNPSEIVCVNIHGMVFSKPVQNGDIVRFSSRIVRAGKTSLTVAVEVSSELTGEHAVKGFLTFVTIDSETGQKKPHGISLDETADLGELSLRREAEEIVSSR